MQSITEPKNLRYVQQLLIVVCLGLIINFLIKLFHARARFIQLKKDGLSMPPHHPVFGHLLIAKNLLSKLPPNAHPSYLPGLIQRAFPDVGQIFYLDMWPMMHPLLVVSSPSVTRQFLQENRLHKSPGLRRWMRPLTDNRDLLSLEDQAWKHWRQIFNPGFSAGHLIRLVPQILKEVSILRDILKERSQCGALFPLDEFIVHLTMDVIGQVVLGTRLNAQTSKSPFVSAFRAQIPWNLYGTEMNPFVRWNPFRPFFQWYYVRVMNRYINYELEKSFEAHQSSNNTKESRIGQYRTVMNLALDKYNEEYPGSKDIRNMNPEFKKYAISQMKGFILAGHDTTSSTLCYIFHLLSCNPLALQRVRAEHDKVFGCDLSKASAIIREDPRSLNRLPFTLAVIKETLRLFPVASTTREGTPGFDLSQNGHQYPTEGFTVWGTQQAMHREPLYWPQSASFVPERWIVSEQDPLYPVKDAWRPFEWGPRSCIGQELALLEMKLVMVMTLREFNVTSSYDAFDHDQGKRRKSNTVDGERAYQVMKGTPRPADGFPCRVTVAIRG